MIQQEILEYNKRCAEFLGWNKTHPKIKDWHIYITPIGHISYDKMLFHSDWNWIMEVVEAIEKLKYLVVIQSNFCQIQEIGTKKNDFKPYIIASIYSNDKKEAVVQAINQFLIWYNENK